MSDIADRYRTLAARFSDTVAAVPSDRWDDPSPCTEWSAREVVNHVVETERDFLARFDLAVPSLPDAGPATAWPPVRDAVQAALDDPPVAVTAYEGYFGPTTLEETIDQFYAFDLLVHRWDVARATGLVDHESMPPDEVTATFAAMSDMGDALRQPGVVGPEVAIDDGADEQSRFLAFLGRQP